MNFEQANTVLISDLLDKLGIQPVSFTGKYIRYFSPFNEEHVLPTFRLDIEANEWYDEAIGEGGNCITFAIQRLKYLEEDHTPYDAVRWISNMSLKEMADKCEGVSGNAQESPYALKAINALTDDSLIDFMSELSIPASACKKYLKELEVYNRKEKKHFVALGMPNEDEGYQFLNSHISDWSGSDRQDVSFIRGLQCKPGNIHVFFDVKDFLSVVSRYPGEAFSDDAIVLHSFECLHKVPPYLYQYNYKHLFSWMPNNHAGNLARTSLSAFCKVEPGLRHRPQNQLYQDHEFVIEFFLCRERLAS